MNWSRAMHGACHHEAGHAVAVYYNGFVIKDVTATNEEWVCNFQHPWISSPVDRRRLACVGMAGTFADMLACWGEIRPDSWEAFEAEVEETLEMLENDPSLEDIIGGDNVGLFELLPGVGGSSLEESYGWVVRDSNASLGALAGDSSSRSRPEDRRDALRGRSRSHH